MRCCLASSIFQSTSTLVVIALWSIDALINALHDSYEEVLAFREVATQGNLSGGQAGGQCDRG